MKPLQTSRSTPAWQVERTAKLQRACQTIAAAVQRGEKIGKAIRRAARSRNGRNFKSDPSRQLALSASSLRRLWDRWNKTGQTPAAFKLNFFRRPSSVPVAMLVRFTKFCAGGPQPCLAEAWRQFSTRGRHPGGRLKIPADRIYHYFPAAEFYLMQAPLRAMETERVELARLRLKVIADIRRRVTSPPPRRRSKNKTLLKGDTRQ